MNVLDFLWLLPGFLFLQIAKQSHSTDKIQSETKYILNLLFASASFALITRLCILSSTNFLNNSVIFEQRFRPFWHRFLPAPYSLTLIVAVMLAFMAGKVTAAILNANPSRFNRSSSRHLDKARLWIYRHSRKSKLTSNLFQFSFEGARKSATLAHTFFYPPRHDTYFVTVKSLLGNTAYLTTLKGKIYIAVVLGAKLHCV